MVDDFIVGELATKLLFREGAVLVRWSVAHWGCGDGEGLERALSYASRRKVNERSTAPSARLVRCASYTFLTPASRASLMVTPLA